MCSCSLSHSHTHTNFFPSLEVRADPKIPTELNCIFPNHWASGSYWKGLIFYNTFLQFSVLYYYITIFRYRFESWSYECAFSVFRLFSELPLSFSLYFPVFIHWKKKNLLLDTNQVRYSWYCCYSHWMISLILWDTFLNWKRKNVL